MKIVRLTEDAIPEIVEEVSKEDEALDQKLRSELKKAQDHGCALYIRYANGWVQFLRVSDNVVDEPDVQKAVTDHDWWIFSSTPNEMRTDDRQEQS